MNDGKVIRENPRVVAVNSATEVDPAGQVCADSMGTCQYSGVGGQMDFMRGAALSKCGKPIIALCSTTGKGASEIVPFLKQGADMDTTRAHVHYAVTEHGVAYLYGRNLQQRTSSFPWMPWMRTNVRPCGIGPHRRPSATSVDLVP